MFRYTQSEKDKIIECLNIIDELISGKFILFNAKISSLLNVIASSEALYGLFAKCIIDYDFAKNLQLGQEYKSVQGVFRVPDNDDELLAFVFCFILEVNNEKLNLHNFVERNYFSPNGYNYSYLNFSRAILVPFKSALMNELGVDESSTNDDTNMGEQMEMDNIQQEIQNTQTGDKILFANLLYALNELHAKVVDDKKIKKDIKDEEYIVVLGLIEAVKLENMKILNALIIPLEYVLGKQKSVKKEYDEVKDCMIEIYKSFAK